MSSLTPMDTVITASTLPVLDLTYAKLHIRALGSIDDALLTVYIAAAGSYFEEQTGRQILTTTREVWLDAFPFVGATGIDARIELPHPPLRSITSVKYIDSSGVLQSFTGGSPVAPLYRSQAPAGAYARRGLVEPVSGQPWPIARAESGAVRIQYSCGYGTTDDVPELVRGILCYLVGHFDTFRTAVHEAKRGQVLELPYGVQMMMDGFKYSAYPTQLLTPTGTYPTSLVQSWV